MRAAVEAAAHLRAQLAVRGARRARAAAALRRADRRRARPARRRAHGAGVGRQRGARGGGGVPPRRRGEPHAHDARQRGRERRVDDRVGRRPRRRVAALLLDGGVGDRARGRRAAAEGDERDAARRLLAVRHVVRRALARRRRGARRGDRAGARADGGVSRSPASGGRSCPGTSCRSACARASSIAAAVLFQLAAPLAHSIFFHYAGGVTLSMVLGASSLRTLPPDGCPAAARPSCSSPPPAGSARRTRGRSANVALYWHWVVAYCAMRFGAVGYFLTFYVTRGGGARPCDPSLPRPPRPPARGPLAPPSHRPPPPPPRAAAAGPGVALCDARAADQARRRRCPRPRLLVAPRPGRPRRHRPRALGAAGNARRLGVAPLLALARRASRRAAAAALRRRQWPPPPLPAADDDGAVPLGGGVRDANGDRHPNAWTRTCAPRLPAVVRRLRHGRVQVEAREGEERHATEECSPICRGLQSSPRPA